MAARIAMCAAMFAVAAWGENRPAADRQKELYEDVCTSCHTLNRVRIQQLNREQWSGLIKGMVDEGAAVTSEEFSMIVDYLARNFGEKKESR